MRGATAYLNPIVMPRYFGGEKLEAMPIEERKAYCLGPASCLRW